MAEMNPPPPVPSESLEARVLTEQLKLTAKQAARFPLPVVVVDAFICWLTWREGFAPTAAAWFLLRALLQLFTAVKMRAMHRRLDSVDASVDVLQREQQLVMLLFCLMGISRAALVPVLFSLPIGETHYVFTIVCMALSAVGVGNVGGALRVYLSFAIPLGVALTAGWLLQNGTTAITISLLLPLVYVFLSMFVRDQGRSQRRIFQLVQESERLAAGLQREHDRAQAALAAKTVFLASASHDLRQPVTTIGLLVGLISEDATDERQKSLLRNVTQSLGALEELLRALLDLSLLESGSVRAKSVPIDLRRLFNVVSIQSQPIAASKGLSLRFRGEHLGVRSDPVLLQQMLTNLVDNALRHTDRGGVLVSARRRGRDRILLQVRDTGRGIATKDQSEVFEEFVQLGNPERNSRKGLGLGLAIVKRNAELLAHPLRLDSRPGVGSCFSIELPSDLAPAEVAVGHTTPSSATGDDRSLNGTLL